MHTAKKATLFVVSVAIRNRDGDLLVVRKRGTRMFMLPGGKVEPGETHPQAAAREVSEEVALTYSPSELDHVATFTAKAANEPGLMIESDVFAPRERSTRAPVASGEIEEVRWLPLERDEASVPEHLLAPLLIEHVIPLLRG